VALTRDTKSIWPKRLYANIFSGLRQGSRHFLPVRLPRHAPINVCFAAPLVAEMLGYSDQVTQKHAAEAGNTWARYVQR